MENISSDFKNYIINLLNFFTNNLFEYISSSYYLNKKQSESSIIPSLIEQENFTNFTCDKCKGTGLISSYFSNCINRNRKILNVKRRFLKDKIISRKIINESNINLKKFNLI